MSSVFLPKVTRGGARAVWAQSPYSLCCHDRWCQGGGSSQPPCSRQRALSLLDILQLIWWKASWEVFSFCRSNLKNAIVWCPGSTLSCPGVRFTFSLHPPTPTLLILFVSVTSLIQAPQEVIIALSCYFTQASKFISRSLPINPSSLQKWDKLQKTKDRKIVELR